MEIIMRPLTNVAQTASNPRHSMLRENSQFQSMHGGQWNQFNGTLSAFIQLAGRQEEHTACKNWVMG